MDMLEKAARASAIAYYAPDGDAEAQAAAGGEWKHFLFHARAVLMAVRDVDYRWADRVCHAADIADSAPYNPSPDAAFTAMIDAILSEGDNQ